MTQTSNRNFLSGFVILWVSAIAVDHNCAGQNCTDFHFVVPPPLRDTENNQTHYVGKLWRIDCRIKDNNSSEGRLYQNGMLREPDDRVLILKEQVFMLLSEKLSDIGEYTCEYCNISKTVGKLIADTSRRLPTIYPLKQKLIVSGSNTTCACEVEGIYDMKWYRVASNGSETLMQSEEESFWTENGFWFTRRRLDIINFTIADEDLYMCVIERSTDNYSAEKEIFLGLRDPSKDILVPFHWYYTSYSETEIDGHLFHTILHVYICHLPVIINLLVIEPVKGIVWTRNFTADHSQPLKLGRNSNYGVTLEMHVHFEGRYKDHLHITACVVRLASKTSDSCIEIMNQKFKTTPRCENRVKCRQPAPNSLVCPRYLDTLEEQLNATFILTLRDPCNGIFNLQIRDGSPQPAINGSLMDMALQNKTQVKMLLKGYDNENDHSTMQGKTKFSQWYLRLQVEAIFFKTYKVKLLLEMPSVGLSGNFLIMEGHYVMDCSSHDESGNERSKIIIAICSALVVFGLLTFAAVLCLYRKFKGRLRDERLLDSMEVEPEVHNL